MADFEYLTVPHLDLRRIARIFWRINVDPDTGCWNWLGPFQKGYALIYINGRQELGHRAMYAWLVAPIQRGLGAKILQIDHVCNNSVCVNPVHLNLTTARENILRSTSPCARHARKTHCPKGHPLVPGNLLTTRTTARSCLICARAYHKAYRARNGRTKRVTKHDDATPD